MKVYVGRIPSEGSVERASYDPRAMDMERPDVHLKEPYTVDARLSLAGSELIVKAHIEAKVHYDCARCLEPFESLIKVDALLNYQVAANDIVDITEDIRQEVILAYPIRALCSNDCQGISIDNSSKA